TAGATRTTCCLPDVPGCSSKPVARRPRRRVYMRTGWRQPWADGAGTRRAPSSTRPVRNGRCGVSPGVGAGGARRRRDGRPAFPGFEDAAVSPDRLADFVRDLRALLVAHDLPGTPYGHFGEGCVHLRVGFGLDLPGGTERLQRFMNDAADLVARHGGTL